MKMSRNGIVTSGRRPSRPDGMYYREARKRPGGYRRRRRGKSAIAFLALGILIGVVAYYWIF